MEENSGRMLRLKRLYRHNPGRLLVVPMDHSVTDGPFAKQVDYEKILNQIAEGGADAVVLHKGRLRSLPVSVYKQLSVIVHVSASTKYASDASEKYIVTSVENAVQRGADAISVHVNLGSETEARQLRDLSEVAEKCEQFGVPLLAMLYARSERIKIYDINKTLAHAATLAADLGADLVKLSLPANADEVESIVSQCPIPIICAGGQKMEEEKFLEYVREVMQGGAAGLAAGRNIFMSADIKALIKKTRHCFSDCETVLPLPAQKSPKSELVFVGHS